MIYADYNATSPVLPSVVEAMSPYFAEEFANSASEHYPAGRRAAEAIARARAQIAHLVNAHEDEVVFVSGGTEAAFAALLGAYLARPARRHFLASPVEHSAVREALHTLTRPPLGALPEFLEVDSAGSLQQERLQSAVRADTGVAALMVANNETGVMWDLADTARLLRERGVVTFADAVQAVGKVPVDFQMLDVDLMSISAHKIGGPKGIGALVIRGGTPWISPMPGGGQERGRRGGTSPVPLIVGFGEAAALAELRLNNQRLNALRACRDAFETRLLSALPESRIQARDVARLPNTSSVTLPGVAALELVRALGERGVMIGVGSACHAREAEPSHVLRAMGLSVQECLATIRVSFGPDTREEQAVLLAEIISAEANAQRERTTKLVSERLEKAVA